MQISLPDQNQKRQEIFYRQKQIEENIRFELKTAEENYGESNKRNMNQLVDKEVFQIFNFF